MSRARSLPRRGIPQRLDDIAARVQALADRDPFRKVFGSAPPTGHDYQVEAPLPEAALEAFESRHRVRLPAAYRAFLSDIGNGRVGPSYGLLPLARAIEGRLPPSAPFPHGNADALRVLRRRVSGREPYAFVGHEEDVPGVIALCEDGCGWVTYLVISGEQRGKVWTGGELGWCPQYFMRRGKPVHHTFLSWYEAWMRGAWRETKLVPFAPPAGDRYNLNGKLLGFLPAALFECTHVTELSLSANKLRTVPDAIGRLQRLRTLDLGGNLLESLPDAIGDLHDLEELHVAYNHLEDLPGAIGKLARLRVLGVQSNPIRTLPATMASLRALRRLALGNTAVEHLPGWLHTLGLEELELDGVHLEDWDELRAFRGGGTLRHLALSMNHALDHIPGAVLEIESLQSLVLGGTAIPEIPRAIARLRNLRTLGLANTQVRALPDELGELPQLTRVVLQRSPVPPADLERARARWPRIVFS